MPQTPAPACLTKKCRSSGGAPASGTPAHSTKLQYISILNQPRKFIFLYYSVFKFKVSIFQCTPNALNALSSMRHQNETVNDNMTFENVYFVVNICCYRLQIIFKERRPQISAASETLKI